MIKSIEVPGRTEDEAIEAALEQLGLGRDDVSVEILERAKTGFLGLKSSPAVVRVQYEAEDDDAGAANGGPKVGPPRPAEAKPSRPSDPGPRPAEAKHAHMAEQKAPRPAEAKPPRPAGAKSGHAAEADRFLTGLLERMGIEAETDVTESDGAVEVSFRCKDPGSLIGRRGETLDAMQHLTNYVVNRGSPDRTRITLDAENYRKRRDETLESLAARTAGKVVKYRRNMTLDPMNAYERHVIHTALQEHANISTYSVGSEPNRRVVVAYGRGKGSPDRSGDGSYREWR